jgi:phytoene dehydrogenase-like protein
MDYDAIIVGAGNNGLSCACKLSMAGARVAVLEATSIVGGAARTEELWPQFNVSSASYVLSLMPPQLINEFGLKEYGLRMLLMDPSMVQPFPNGKQLTMWRDPLKTLDEIAKFSERDAETAVKYYEVWDRFFQVFDKHLLTPNPPMLGQLEEELIHADMAHLLPLMLYGSMGDFLDEYFESEEVKAALVPEALIGSFTGPYTPGNMANMILHSMGMSTGVRGAWAYVEGGMGAVSRALKSCAESHGAKIFTDCEVSSVIVEGERAKGVRLKDGRLLSSKVVISSADIKRSILTLLGEDQVSSEDRRRIRALKNEGVSTKIHLALSQLPRFREGLDTNTVSSSIIHIGPSLTYLERAFDQAKYGEPSREPFVSLEFPTVHDKTLAPPGKHIASMFVQYTPYTLKNAQWDQIKQDYLDTVLDTLTPYVPNIREHIIHTHMYTPRDLEKTINISGGNIHHIDVNLAQSFGNRPLPSWGYTTPVKSYYLCGADTYPGGGVSGINGYNAATKVLLDLKGA